MLPDASSFSISSQMSIGAPDLDGLFCLEACDTGNLLVRKSFACSFLLDITGASTSTALPLPFQKLRGTVSFSEEAELSWTCLSSTAVLYIARDDGPA
jgi:hypothetical protein